jgi:dihydroorotase
MITSDHNPMDIEHKKWSLIWQKMELSDLKVLMRFDDRTALEKVIEKLTSGKTIFGIENQAIEEGGVANITLFNPQGKIFY